VGAYSSDLDIRLTEAHLHRLVLEHRDAELWQCFDCVEEGFPIVVEIVCSGYLLQPGQDVIELINESTIQLLHPDILAILLETELAALQIGGRHMHTRLGCEQSP
jgi:hypothetical protein